MTDYAFPNNNENDFIKIAERLGIKELCFIYDSIKEPPKSDTVKTSSAVLCTRKNIQKFKGKTTTLIDASKDDNARAIIEQAKPDIVFNLELSPRSDFIHHRASGINHIIAKIATENKVAIGFSLSSILSATPKRRAIIMGRISQNIKLASKYNTTTLFASFAKSPYHLRQHLALESLRNCISHK